MNAKWYDIAHRTLEGAESGTQTFAEDARELMAAGFDGYSVDFRCSTLTYYPPDGQTMTLTAAATNPVADHFDANAIKVAINEAQAMVPATRTRVFAPR